ncbi:7979_t:CDS:2 [Ambispora gerdemannii]|uniref:7979_t:CDS:1 n=1 Tax=Ambispora gerdemannii TaxID=144530 RepID=A0A9N9AW41_9GLOM|nr:7979_t:CDS:2 [Ambispora gerdemannii]
MSEVNSISEANSSVNNLISESFSPSTTPSLKPNSQIVSRSIETNERYEPKENQIDVILNLDRQHIATEYESLNNAQSYLNNSRVKNQETVIEPNISGSNESLLQPSSNKEYKPFADPKVENILAPPSGANLLLTHMQSLSWEQKYDAKREYPFVNNPSGIHYYASSPFGYFTTYTDVCNFAENGTRSNLSSADPKFSCLDPTCPQCRYEYLMANQSFNSSSVYGSSPGGLPYPQQINTISNIPPALYSSSQSYATNGVRKPEFTTSDLTSQEACSSYSQYSAPVPVTFDEEGPRTKTGELLRCNNCGATETPAWRRDSEGVNLLCNACGLYLKIKGRHRPIEIGPDGEIRLVKPERRNNTHKCEECGVTGINFYRGSDGRQLCDRCGCKEKATLPQSDPSIVFRASSESNEESLRYHPY